MIIRRFCTTVASTLHKPAMLSQVVSILQPQPHQVFLDCTFGAGGHTKGLLASSSSLTVFALDRDPLAFGLATQLSQQITGSSKVVPLHGRFSQLPQLLSGCGVMENSFDGVLIDTGCSSMQFDSASRGFSLSTDGPLDMRMDPTGTDLSASDVVNNLTAAEMTSIFTAYGEEPKSKQIAQAIVDHRTEFGPILTTKELATVVSKVSSGRSDSLGHYSHSATRVFMAIRIFVNDELNELDCAIHLAHRYLKAGTGRLVVVSFHSLEDRIVKRHFLGIPMDEPFRMTLSDQRRMGNRKDDNMSMKWRVVQRKILTPTEDEIQQNSRVRSARLRAAVKQFQ